ncbi:hypothetical protein [Kangiella sp. TOML190]|uniref:hypothetical protein n=1 Tax=Kangiella sp. TOML190 TaxID=2931351 RepID=UPI00203DA93B|nr:hypothetical protein [Kangiella sp. TOML190]
MSNRLNIKGLLKALGLVTSSLILLISCKSAPVVEEKPVVVAPPPKPAKTYKTVNIGSKNYMMIPSHWQLKKGLMPKGFVRYSIQNPHFHFVLTGFKSPKHAFSKTKNRKELDSKTLLYWSGSTDRQKNYKALDDEHKSGEYVEYSCKSRSKCYQVFPLSHWQSVVATELHVNDMKYNITAGVDDLLGPHAKELIQAVRSIKVQSL